MNIRLTKAEKIRILNSFDVYEIMQRILLRENKIDRDKEHFWIIGLATNNTILFIELISLGSHRATLAEPMECFRVAVLKGAKKIIVVHNHPSEDPVPSESDKEATLSLVMAGIILGIPVIDHFIITTTTFMTFSHIGLLQEITDRARWLTLAGEDMLEDFQKDVQKATLIKTALKLIEEGADDDLIRKVTGFKPNQIAKIRRDMEEEKASKGKKKSKPANG